MKMRFIITLAILLSFPITVLFSQNVEFEKDNFPKEQKQAFKEAVNNMEEGDMLMEQGKYKFKDAITNYMHAQNFNPDNALLNYKIGKCYLFGSIYKDKALNYFKRAAELDPNVDPEIFYMIGQAFHIHGDWDKAIQSFKTYKKSFSSSTAMSVVEMVNKKIEECETGIELESKPERVFIDNLGGVINTKDPEYGACISADESVMVFTSRRSNTTGGQKDAYINEYYEDVYIAYNIDGNWTTPVNLGKPINTEGHDATISLSADAQKMLIYKDDGGDGNVYETDLIGDIWRKPYKLGKTVNSKAQEPTACFSYDGRHLYFVSAREEGSLGGKDIYYSEWDDEKARWGEAINMGPTINTKYDEDGVFMHVDGKTMFFSSKGHKTMGGYDIFKSVSENGVWSEPVNVGFPINSPDDDVFFVLNASGRRGYYSSFKLDGEGEKDIYMITFLGPEKPMMLSNEDNLIASIAQPVKEVAIEPAVEVVNSKVTILKGVVTNAANNEPLEGKIELYDNDKNELVSAFKSNSLTGKYLVSLPSGKNYGLAVKKEGFLFHSENFLIPESAAYMEVVKNVALKKIEVGSKIVLRNIFFDYNKYSLKTESTAELLRVIKIMTDNPTLVVEISGHTDSQGSDDYNQNLSQNRAKSVVDYLTKNGVASSRLQFKGYGESQPISTNDTEEGRQLNRRTEFKVIGP